MLHPVEKAKNKFILKLNKQLYKDAVLDKVASEDKPWVKKLKSQGKYVYIELKTEDLKEALEWSNYLLYLNRAL